MANTCKCGIWSTQSLIIRSKVLLLSKHGQIFMTQLFINGPFQKKSNMPSRLLKLQAPPSETIVPQVFIDISTYGSTTFTWEYSCVSMGEHSPAHHTMAVGPGSHEKNTCFFSMLKFNSTHSFARIAQSIVRFTLCIYIICVYNIYMYIIYIYISVYISIFIIIFMSPVCEYMKLCCISTILGSPSSTVSVSTTGSYKLSDRWSHKRHSGQSKNTYPLVN